MRLVVTARIVAAATAVALLSSSLPALQQTGASRVALATVVDPRNRPIVDVEADDFVVTEDGRPREILSVHIADYPVVVMIDTGVNATADLPAIQKAAAHFIDRMGQRPVALGTFGDPAAILATFDDDRMQLLERLASIGPSSAASLLLRGTSLATDVVRATGALFSAIIVLSASPVDESHETDAIIGRVVESGAIVHVVANRSAHADWRGMALGSQVATLRALVDQTRGQFTTIYTAASYQAALDQIAARLATEIMIEYLVPPQSKPSDVKIGVRIPGARVRGFGVAPR